MLALILFPAPGERRLPDTALWLLAGLLVGLSMLAKYHGIFVLAGTFLFLLTSRAHRRQLLTAGPYLGAIVALACLAPVVLWNREHGWASFAFQGGRASGRGGVHLDTFLANVGGQMAWVLPWICSRKERYNCTSSLRASSTPSRRSM